MKYGGKVCIILDNVLHKVTIIIVKHVFHFTRATSKIWKNCDRTLCQYVIELYTCIGHIHLLAIMCLKKKYTTMSECMIFYGPIVPEINYSILLTVNMDNLLKVCGHLPNFKYS